MKMTSKIMADVFCLAASLHDTVCSYLLVDHARTSIPLSDLEISKSDSEKIMRYAADINAACKNEFTIRADTIDIHADALAQVKPFLMRQFVKLVAPHDYSTPPIHEDRNTENTVYSRAFWNRYVTRNGYAADTLQLFADMTERLYVTPVLTPSLAAEPLLSEFVDFIRCNTRAWKEVLGGLLTGKFQQGADVTDRLASRPRTYARFEQVGHALQVPALLIDADDKLTVSSAFFQDSSVALPYLIALFDLAYSHPSLQHRLLFSHIRNRA